MISGSSWWKTTIMYHVMYLREGILYIILYCTLTWIWKLGIFFLVDWCDTIFKSILCLWSLDHFIDGSTTHLRLDVRKTRIKNLWRWISSRKMTVKKKFILVVRYFHRAYYIRLNTFDSYESVFLFFAFVSILITSIWHSPILLCRCVLLREEVKLELDNLNFQKTIFV